MPVGAEGETVRIELGGKGDLQADIKATFPDADIIGLRLINGRPTKALLEITNNEDGPIGLAYVTGALSTTKELPADAPAYESILRNLTAVPYNMQIAAGESKQVPYAFSLDMHPQDVQLQIIALITSSKGNIHQVAAFSDAASVVEAPTNFLDPQM